MHKLLAALFLLTMCVPFLRGQSAVRWTEVRSPNFIVLTDANDKQARRIAIHFERMRAVFHTVLPNATGNAGSPITVLALKDKKGPSVLALEVEGPGQPVRLYSNNFYKIAFTLADPAMNADIEPCTTIEGMKARVKYAEVADPRVKGQIVSVELRK